MKDCRISIPWQCFFFFLVLFEVKVIWKMKVYCKMDFFFPTSSALHSSDSTEMSPVLSYLLKTMHLGRSWTAIPVLLHCYFLWKSSHVKVCTSTCKLKEVEDKWVVNLAQSDKRVRVGIVLSYFCKKTAKSWLDHSGMECNWLEDESWANSQSWADSSCFPNLEWFKHFNFDFLLHFWK